MTGSDSSDYQTDNENIKLNSKQPLKRLKRGLCVFNDAWLSMDSYKEWLGRVKNKNDSAFCAVCRKEFVIKYRGLKAIESHSESQNHIKNIRESTSSNLISNFFGNKNADSKQAFKTIRAELALTFHGVKHHHSYLSQDCGNKLNKSIFKDSEIVHHFNLGRTKTEALVECVLAPHSLEMILNQIKNNPYSICIDASNKGNLKLFPVAVRYFDENSGTQNAIIDFYEDSNETSLEIFKKLIKSIEQVNLNENKLTSFGADSANVNYGRNNSVYVHLKNHFSNTNLIAGRCNVHVLHNTCKHGLKLLSHDVESFVLKVYSEFSSSAKELQVLKEFCEFVNCKYSNIIKHVPTRFLSLYDAVDRVLQNWPALKSYFVSKGQNKVPNIIWKFMNADDINTTYLAELYLYFVHNVMHLFNKNMKILESDYIQSTSIYMILSNLKSELRNRREKQFFGYKVNQLINQLLPAEKNKFITEGISVYDRMISYLEKWFNFDEHSFFFLCKVLDLENELEMDGVCKLIEFLSIPFDGDELFTEICLFNKVFTTLKEMKISDADISKIWATYFKKNVNSPILLNIVRHVFSVPANNCFVERIFSVMGNIWTDERNRLKIDMVRAELLVHFNYKMNCSDFFHYIQENSNSNKKLLEAAMSSKKYKFLNK